MRYRGLLALTTVAAACSGCASGGTAPAPRHRVPPRPLALYADGVRVGMVRHGGARLRLPERLTIRRGRATIIATVPLVRARRTVRRALSSRQPDVSLPVRLVSSSIHVAPVRQVLHNDCEVTALSMLLAVAGRRVGQLELQALLPRSGPLDPEPVAGSSLFRWGDPERGFVGRPNGGGPEGGFGVYEPPIRALAARYGVHLADLRGRSVAAVEDAVLAGHPVLAWIGLAAGPYLRWLTPSGRPITVNLDEHAVLLVGAGRGYVLVNDPLSGRRERWSDALFSYRWKLLGRRALALMRP